MGMGADRMTFNPFAPIVTKLLGSLSLALLLVVAGMWWRIGHLESDNKALATRLIEQRAEFVAKSEEAARKALAAKQATEARYRTLAQETDHEAETALADARSRADLYAKRMSPKAFCVPSSGTSSPSGGGGPESPDRSGEDAGMVALSRPDFDTLIENTIRLNEAQRWALSLNQEPVPAVEF